MIKSMFRFVFSVAMFAAAAQAQILQVTSGTQPITPAFLSSAGFTCPCFVGLTFTTPGSGPWNNVTFNFFANPAVGNAPASGPETFGTAFLLTQPYFGAPSALGSSTPGYVAASTSIAGGVNVFPAGVLLNPNTQYWLYESVGFTTGTVTGIGSGAGASAPGIFVASTNVPNFIQGLGTLNYALGGTPVGTSGCTYSISVGGNSAGAQSFTAAGGSSSFAITTGGGCSWSAASSAAWITIAGGSSGSGNGGISFNVAANTGAAQSASINITTMTGNISFAVQQGAASVTTYTNMGSMAQQASAGAWTTTYTFVNTGSTVAQMRLNFFNAIGIASPLSLTFLQSPNAVGPLVASTLDETIQPGAELVIQSGGPVSQMTATGWAQLLTNGSITGFATFSQAIPGFPVQDAVVPLETRNANAYTIAFDNTNGNSTGIAMANLTAQALSVTITYYVGGAAGYSTAGVNDFSNNYTLGPHSQASFNLATQYSDTAGQRGTLVFSTPSNGQVSLLGLRFNSSGAFSTIPALLQ